MRLIILLGSIYCLLGCGSSPTIDTQHYFLNTPLTQAEFSEIQHKVFPEHREKVLLKIDVADYLQQPFLIMQTDKHSIQYAQSHLWAEPLENELARALKHDLNGANPNIQFTIIEENNEGQQANKLLIDIEHFHATSSGKVILSGHFQWLRSQDKNGNTTGSNGIQPFYLEQVLTQDGYAHSVVQMRRLLEQLAQQITRP